ncbi:tRNA pseudouridine(13) synthase TruD [Seongchinamella sediminis]|uniref:tRNA pseudouridine synthase D n=1 Tax=Seongchinamella sediminis TaxID=2283635 RepID=A0A3L7E3A8_9GAMM|nr:tRNA pseudouridine(13) synthase TruD [Seongchinamella sediminis]RLQ22772.1 tRNA pseudouridine(13) synthase TruD [Seongchinamella sediminis]
MSEPWPCALGGPVASGRLRSVAGDFRVDEELGFEPDGDGEHVFLRLEKTGLNTSDLAQRIASLSGIHLRDISFSGMKDRNAVTRQWFSVRMAGRAEPDWTELAASGDVAVLQVSRHRRKLKRGVHRANRFRLVLRELTGDRGAIEQRLSAIRAQGAPNYFGEQRFGRGGANLVQALRWIDSGGRRLSRNKRSLYLSVLRAQLFNLLLADRVRTGDWNRVLAGDSCILAGTRSQFFCPEPDADIARRCAAADLHPALPLWGRGIEQLAGDAQQRRSLAVADFCGVADFLLAQGLDLDWRASRLVPDDFCWQFCDHGSLQLEFRLGAGSFATALLGECFRYA